VLEEAYRAGARFDGWDECFDWGRYVSAFARCGLDPDFYANRVRGGREALPWDHLGHDNKDVLYRRYRKILDMLQAEGDCEMENEGKRD